MLNFEHLKKEVNMSLKNVGVPVAAYNKIMAYREKIKKEEGYYLSAGAVVAKALFAYLEQNNIKLDEERG